MTHTLNPGMETLWADILDRSDVGEDADFIDCGGTSIQAVYLAARIQETYLVPVDAIEIITLRTLSKISELVAVRHQQAS